MVRRLSSAPSLRSGGSTVNFGWGLVPFGGYGYGYGYPGAYGGGGGGGGLGNLLLYGILAVFAFTAVQSLLNRNGDDTSDYGGYTLLLPKRWLCAAPESPAPASQWDRGELTMVLKSAVVLWTPGSWRQKVWALWVQWTRRQLTTSPGRKGEPQPVEASWRWICGACPWLSTLFAWA